MKCGGQAFPIPGGESEPRMGCEGMTLRDYFAAAALAHPYTRYAEDCEETDPLAAARWAYELADAMLSARDSKEVA